MHRVRRRRASPLRPQDVATTPGRSEQPQNSHPPCQGSQKGGKKLRRAPLPGGHPRPLIPLVAHNLRLSCSPEQNQQSASTQHRTLRSLVDRVRYGLPGTSLASLATGLAPNKPAGPAMHANAALADMIQCLSAAKSGTAPSRKPLGPQQSRAAAPSRPFSFGRGATQEGPSFDHFLGVSWLPGPDG